MNSVDELLKTPFSRRSFEDQLNIKSLARPMPNIDLSQSAKSKNTAYKRRFNADIYKEVSWLCGCDKRNALFCFPCVLFKGEFSWSIKGVTDLGHLKSYIKRHSGNKTHILNVLNLLNIGRVNIATQVDSAYRQSIQKHNEQVEKNRYVLSKIIDCIKFCGAFELALRGQDVSDSSGNPGIFGGLIDLMGSLDTAIGEHVKGNTIFKDTSKTIQNELLDCMLAICHEEIKSQIAAAAYVAIIVDDTTDVSTTTHTVLVLRYEHSARVYERFWSFLNPAGLDASAISESILQNIRSLIHIKNAEKLIAQSYDGAAGMSHQVHGVQAKVREVYNGARFIHCYAHQLDLIISQSASQNKSARVFFSSLSAIPAFFSGSPQRLTVLNRAVARRIPDKSNSIPWDSKSRIQVNVVYENRYALIECLEELENLRSAETVQKARALRHYLEDKEFNFWLAFFQKVMPHVDMLFEQIQSRQANSPDIRNAVECFVRVVRELRGEIDTILTDIDTIHANPSKRVKQEDSLAEDAQEVCDLIISQTQSRFDFVEYFDVAKLIDRVEFNSNSKKFPENNLQIAVDTYPTLEKNKLKTELAVLYGRPDFRNVEGALPLLGFIVDNNIEDTFEELTKLLKILVTIPVLSAEEGRYFSTLKRIKTFLRNTISQQCLSALAMLSIEQDMIRGIKNFNSRVIDRFVNYNSRHVDFIFRH